MVMSENGGNRTDLDEQEGHRMSSDADAQQDLSGITKIIPEVFVCSNFKLTICHNLSRVFDFLLTMEASLKVANTCNPFVLFETDGLRLLVDIRC